jgi:hypothetical protein
VSKFRRPERHSHSLTDKRSSLLRAAFTFVTVLTRSIGLLGKVIELSKGTQANDGSWKFAGQIGIPQKERKSYQDLLEQYHRMDVQWTSDEEAAVKWILTKDPNFFSRQIPFIGYLQFLFETTLNGGQRIEKIKSDVAYGVSGLSTIPKDKHAEEGRNVPWRFRSE